MTYLISHTLTPTMKLDHPLPSTCYLNTSENATSLKSKLNPLGPKSQKRKQRLHLGAKKIDPTFFSLVEKENEKKTFFNTELNRSRENNFRTHTKAISTEDSEEEKEGLEDELDRVRGTADNEYTLKNTVYLMTNSSRRSKSPAKLNKQRAVSEVITKVDSAKPNLEQHITDEALKKFRSAKSISSERYFNEIDGPAEYKTDLSRFTNCSSISSDDVFDRPPKGSDLSDSFFTSRGNIRYEELTTSLRNGVTKAAGKLGSSLVSFASRMPLEFPAF